MEHKTRNKIAGISSLVGLFISLDQLSKYIVRHPPAGGGGFYICNPDIAFGIGIPAAIFWVFWIIIVGFVIRALWMTLEHRAQDMSGQQVAISQRGIKSLFNILPFALLLAGAFSNMIDRMVFGCVTDMIDLRVWPVFNLADVFIVSGAVIWLANRRKMW